MFIIAIGYFLFNIPILFYPIMFSKDITDSILLVLIAGLIPLIVDLILIPVFFSLFRKTKKKQIELKSHYDKLDKFNSMAIQKFYELFDKLNKPNLPKDKINPVFITEIIKVFESKRADTLKEALVIYEQDCQHRELVRQQNALIAAANNAQRESEAAKKAAAQAKADADYARREADYHFWRNQ